MPYWLLVTQHTHATTHHEVANGAMEDCHVCFMCVCVSERTIQTADITVAGNQ